MTFRLKISENGSCFLFSSPSLKRFRKNEDIRFPEIFLVDERGEKMGVLPTEKALSLARERGFDLVEVAPDARPPVCRLLDFGSFLFEQKKREKMQRKASKMAEMKGIRFGIRISPHDFGVKVSAARRFLEKGHAVKATLQFRGREITHDELGVKKLEEFRDTLSDIARVDQEPKRQGKQIIMTLFPEKNPRKKSSSMEEDSE